MDDAAVSSVGLDGYSAALRRSFQLSPVATSISRVDDGRILDANEAYCALFGYGRAELVGRSMTEVGLIAGPLARAVRASAERIDTRLQDYDIQVRVRSGEVRSVVVSAEAMDAMGNRGAS